MTPSTFEIKVIQKQATPDPVGTVVGTGTSATRVEFFVSLPAWCPHRGARLSEHATICKRDSLRL